MQEFNLSEGGHEWEKVNIVTMYGKNLMTYISVNDAA